MRASGSLLVTGVIDGIDGKDGDNGKDGFNTAEVSLYRRSSTALTNSDRPTGILIYSFQTGKLTGAADSFNSWTQEIPAAVVGTKLYVVKAVAHSQASRDAIDSSEWSTPVEYVVDGTNSAPVLIYKRAASVSDKPADGAVYSFKTGVLSGTLNGWSTSIPATDSNHNPCWVRHAMAVSNGETDTIGASEWSDAIKLVEDGAEGKGYKAILYRNSFTETEWNNNATVGSPTTWDTTSDVSGKVAVGDWFLVVGTATDTKYYHTTTFECTSKDDTHLTGKCINHQITKDGKDAFVGDITNEADLIGTDSNGVVQGDQTRTTKVHLWLGSTKQTLTANPTVSLTYASGGSVGSTVAEVTEASGNGTNEGTVKIKVKNKATLTDVIYADITVTCGTYPSKTIRFTLKPVKSGAPGVSPTLYQVKPTRTEISFARDSSNELTPSSVSVGCGYTKNYNGTITAYDGSNDDNLYGIDGKYNIFFRYIKSDGTPTQNWDWLKDRGSDNYQLVIPNTTTYIACEFCISSSSSYATVGDGNIIDRETVPIIKDSLQINPNLLDGTSLIKNIKAWDNITCPLKDGVLGNRSCTAIQATQTNWEMLKQYLWKKNSADNKVVLGQWYTLSFYIKSSRQLNGAYIYLSSNANSTVIGNEVIIDGVTKQRWVGGYLFSLDTEWTYHTFTFCIDSTLSDSVTSFYLAFCFYDAGQASTYPTTLQYSSMKLEEGKVATSWCLSENDKIVPTNPNILLRTIFDKTIDFVKEEWGKSSWSWISISDSESHIIDGKKSIYLDASSLASSSYIDFQQNVFSRIKTSTWYTLSFNSFSSDVYRTFLYDTSDKTAWIDTSAGVYIDGVYRSSISIDGYISWPQSANGVRHTLTFKTNSSFSTDQARVLFRLYGGKTLALCMLKLEEGREATPYTPHDDDLKGQTGSTGKMCYIAGEYKSSLTYISNDNQTVAVEMPQADGTSEIWVLKAATNVVNGVHYGPVDGSPYWEQGLNAYNIIRTQYLFAQFANLGKFIVSGDYFFSQYGTLVDIDGNETEIDTKEKAEDYYEGAPPYMYFDGSDPMAEDYPPDYYKFRPTLALDAMTGRIYALSAYIKGNVAVKSGVIDLVKTKVILTSGGGQSTLIEGGKIKTSLLDVGTIVANGIKGKTIDADNAKISNLEVSGTIMANVMYSPTTVLTNTGYETTINIDLTQHTSNILCKAEGLGSKLYMVLPSPSTYDGLELTFFFPILNARQFGGCFIKYTGGNIYYLDTSTSLLTGANTLGIVGNQLVRVRAIGNIWYVIEGTVSAT